MSLIRYMFLRGYAVCDKSLFLKMLLIVFGLTFGASLALANDPAGDSSKSEKASGAEENVHIGHANAGPDLNKPEDFKWDLSLYTFVVFLLLVGVLGKFAWGPIVQGLEKREHGIASQIESAEKANQHAQELLADYEKKLATAQEQVKAMHDDARKVAETTKQSILTEAKAGAEAERDRAVKDIELATDKALKELAEKSANLAVDLAGKIVKAKLTASDHSKLIQEAVAKFPQTTPGRN